MRNRYIFKSEPNIFEEDKVGTKPKFEARPKCGTRPNLLLGQARFESMPFRTVFFKCMGLPLYILVELVKKVDN